MRRRHTFWDHSAGHGGGVAGAEAVAVAVSQRSAGGHRNMLIGGTGVASPKLGRGKVRYEFSWWGRSYSWRRAADPHLGLVGFHLVRDDESHPIAHIVPETRAPNQVLADEMAGGWVPPCVMWIAGEGVVDAVTDVGEYVLFFVPFLSLVSSS